MQIFYDEIVDDSSATSGEFERSLAVLEGFVHMEKSAGEGSMGKEV